MEDDNVLNIAIIDEEARTVTYVDEDKGLVTLKMRPPDGPTVNLILPLDVLEALERVAKERRESLKSLLGMYLSHGMRQDNARHFTSRILAKLPEVLEKHSLEAIEISFLLTTLQQIAGKGSHWQDWSRLPTGPRSSEIVNTVLAYGDES